MFVKNPNNDNNNDSFSIYFSFTKYLNVFNIFL